jgi:hypothetical protein
MVGHAETFHLAAVSGRRAETQKVLDQLTELSKQKYVPALDMVISAGLGEKNKALEWLEKADEDRSVGSSFANNSVNPEYDPLRSDPRFQDLLRRLKHQP